MSWFNFLSTINNNGQIVAAVLQERYPPVRRKIIFPLLQENIKVGDWIYANLQDVEVGKVYSYTQGAVLSVADSDSYLVVYENNETYQPTYSYIDEDNNLFFKAINNIDAGNFDTGNYYIYYHYNNLQRLQLSENNYVQLQAPFKGFMAFDNGSGTQQSNINRYSNVVLGNSSNDRIASISYISSSGSWINQECESPGNKVIGNFDGPYLKIYGKKSSNSGKVSIKIIKTSTSGLGQSIVKTDIIDLYNSSNLEDAEIYSLNLKNQTSSFSKEELYGSFMFELEVLNDKNVSSSGKKVKINKYSFSKNHYLFLNDEEIYEGISFVSTGVIR